MDFANLSDEEINALHRAVMDEWIKRNTPSDEDIERMTAGADELLHQMVEQSRQAMKSITGA